MKGKKAISTTDFFLWIGKLLLLVMLLISIYFIARIYEQKEIDTAEIEAGIFRNYILYSPHAISYRDVYSDRIFPGTVDVANLNSDLLESAANFGKTNDMIAAIITLSDSQKKTVKQVYYNEKRYNDWLPMAQSTFLGRGAILKADKESYVLYVDSDGKTKPGILKTEVLVPRT